MGLWALWPLGYMLIVWTPQRTSDKEDRKSASRALELEGRERKGQERNRGRGRGWGCGVVYELKNTMSTMEHRSCNAIAHGRIRNKILSTGNWAWFGMAIRSVRILDLKLSKY